MRTKKRSPVPETTGAFVGDLVTWEFADADAGFGATRQKVREIFARNFFDGIVEERDAGEVLLAIRNGHGVAKGRGILVRPFARPNKDTPAALGVYRKIENTGETGDTFPPEMRVRIEANRAVAMPVEGRDPLQPLDDHCVKVAEALAKRCNEVLDEVSNNELSGYLITAGRRLMWSAFRRKGGVYYVHEKHAMKFRDLLDDLERNGQFWPTVQPLFTDDGSRTMKNVERASIAAFEKELEDLEKKLSKLVDDGKGGRASALENRLEECQELFERAALHRTLLKERGQALEAQLTSVRGAFQEALDGMKSEFDVAVDAVKSKPAKKQPEPIVDNDDVFSL